MRKIKLDNELLKQENKAIKSQDLGLFILIKSSGYYDQHNHAVTIEGMSEANLLSWMTARLKHNKLRGNQYVNLNQSLQRLTEQQYITQSTYWEDGMTYTMVEPAKGFTLIEQDDLDKIIDNSHDDTVNQTLKHISSYCALAVNIFNKKNIPTDGILTKAIKEVAAEARLSTKQFTANLDWLISNQIAYTRSIDGKDYYALDKDKLDGNCNRLLSRGADHTDSQDTTQQAESTLFKSDFKTVTDVSTQSNAISHDESEKALDDQYEVLDKFFDDNKEDDKGDEPEKIVNFDELLGQTEKTETPNKPSDSNKDFSWDDVWNNYQSKIGELPSWAKSKIKKAAEDKTYTPELMWNVLETSWEIVKRNGEKVIEPAHKVNRLMQLLDQGIGLIKRQARENNMTEKLAEEIRTQPKFKRGKYKPQGKVKPVNNELVEADRDMSQIDIDELDVTKKKPNPVNIVAEDNGWDVLSDPFATAK